MRFTISTSIIFCSLFLAASCMMGDAGAGAFSVPDGVKISYGQTPNTAALEANPEAGTVQENGRYIMISWRYTRDTDYTAVWRSPDVKSDWFCLSWGNSGSFYHDYQVEPGDTWFYRVQAVPSNYSGRDPSPFTEAVQGTVPRDERNTLSVPRNFTAVADPGSSGSVRLAWEAVTGAEGYRIYRRYGNWEPWLPAQGIDVAGKTEYDDSGLAQGRTWEYRVSAYSAAEYSLQAETSAKTWLTGYTTAASSFAYAFEQGDSRTETFCLDNTLNSLYVSCPVSGLSAVSATWTDLNGKGSFFYEAWALSDTGAYTLVSKGGVTDGESTAIPVGSGVQVLFIRTEALTDSGFTTMLYSLKLEKL